MCLVFRRVIVVFIFILLAKKSPVLETEYSLLCSEVAHHLIILWACSSHSASSTSSHLHPNIPSGPWVFMAKIVFASPNSSVHTAVPHCIQFESRPRNERSWHIFLTSSTWMLGKTLLCPLSSAIAVSFYSMQNGVCSFYSVIKYWQKTSDHSNFIFCNFLHYVPLSFPENIFSE